MNRELNRRQLIRGTGITLGTCLIGPSEVTAKRNDSQTRAEVIDVQIVHKLNPKLGGDWGLPQVDICRPPQWERDSSILSVAISSENRENINGDPLQSDSGFLLAPGYIGDNDTVVTELSHGLLPRRAVQLASKQPMPDIRLTKPKRGRIAITVTASDRPIDIFRNRTTIDVAVGEQIAEGLYELPLRVEVTRVLDELVSRSEVNDSQLGPWDEIPDWRLPRKTESKKVTVNALGTVVVRNRGMTTITTNG